MKSLNEIPFGGGKPIPVLDAGLYPARLAEVIELGIQKGRVYKGEQKPPSLEYMLTFECLDEFLENDKGEPDETKPRFFSLRFVPKNISSIRATSTIVYKALDPEYAFGGDFTKLVNTPCVIELVRNKGEAGKPDKNYISSVLPMRAKEKLKAKPLVNPAIIFDFYNFDPDVFKSLKPWQQTVIKEALDWNGREVLAPVDGEPQVDKPKDEEEEAW